MADQPSYIVPTDKEPTYFNRDMLNGALWTGGLLSIPGAILGAVLGHERMERDKDSGKRVDPPTFWNKTTFIGAGAGGSVGALGGLIAAGATLALGLTTGGVGILAAEMTTLAFAAGGSIAGAVVGGYFGGKQGKKRMTQEYAEAENNPAARIVGQQEPVRNVNQEQVKGQYMNNLSTEEQAKLQAAMNALDDQKATARLATQPDVSQVLG